MADAIDEVIKHLIEASASVGGPYMRLPVAGAKPQYRERVYCYELYHQWRCRWSDNSRYALCGETDKRRHAHIRGKYLDDIKPDFLVHEPGQMYPDSNLLAVEVKPVNVIPPKIVDDLRKLTALRRDLKNSMGEAANYQHAIFWLYGGFPAEWEEVKRQIKHNEFDDIDLSLVRCFVHERPGRPAEKHDW